VNTNAYNKDSIAPVHIAIKKGVENMLNWIILTNNRNKHDRSKQFNLKLECGKDKNTPLHIACKSGSVNSIKLLAKHSDMFAKNADGKTPIQELKSIFAINKILEKYRKRQVETTSKFSSVNYTSANRANVCSSDSYRGYTLYSASVRKLQNPLQISPCTQAINKVWPKVKQKLAFDYIWNRPNPHHIKLHYLNSMLQESNGNIKLNTIFDISAPNCILDDASYRITANNNCIYFRNSAIDDSEVIESARHEECRRRPKSQDPFNHRSQGSINSILTTQNKKSPSYYFNQSSLRKENQLFTISNYLKCN
jgi:hypothetical protein